MYTKFDIGDIVQHVEDDNVVFEICSINREEGLYRGSNHDKFLDYEFYESELKLAESSSKEEINESRELVFARFT